MTKFGRGLNREIVAAVNSGELPEPLSIESVRSFVASRAWNVTEHYVIAALANGSNESHSPTYRKYFEVVSRGRYRVRHEYRGKDWL